MTDFNFTTLSINGYAQKEVPNVFLRQKGPANTLAILFPGLRYSCDMPLLYYPSRLLAHRGADVLQLNTDYTQADYQSASQSEQFDWLVADARAATQTGSAQRAYQRLILVGKSIGTLALAHLVSSPLGEKAITIWLTPLLRQQPLVAAALNYKGPALYVAGTGDPVYVAASMQRIMDATDAEALIVEGANHSMELPDDPLQSIQILERIVRGIADFLDKLG